MYDVTRRNAIKIAAVAGIVGVVGSDAVADEQKNEDTARTDMWRAWATTAGTETKLVIEGTYEQGGPGRVAMLKPAVPQGINPKILLMELTLASLPGVWPAVVIPIPASYIQAPYKKGQYESVQVRYPDGRMESIKEIIDAGDGPKSPAKKDK